MMARRALLSCICAAVVTPGQAVLLRAPHQLRNDSLYLPPGNYANGEHPNESHCFERAMKEQSLVEAHLTSSDICIYGAHVPKIPFSIVGKVFALKEGMSSEKIYRYNFQGSITSFQQNGEKERRRQWAMDIVANNFTDNDLLVVCEDIPSGHVPLGPYDHSNDAEVLGRTGNSALLDGILFDATYYKFMIQSNFTLCPGGDVPWSMRFYEAILAGSIPVIDSVEDDYSDSSIAFWFAHIGYTYFTTQQLASGTMSDANLSNIAAENLDLLLRYQTWISGDLVPPAYSAYSAPCLSNVNCRDRVQERGCTR